MRSLAVANSGELLSSSFPHGALHDFWWSLALSFALSLIIELSDKSFLILSVLSRRQSALSLCISAAAAVAVAAGVSCALGAVYSSLVDSSYTAISAFCLFLLLSFLSFEEVVASTAKADIVEVEEQLADRSQQWCATWTLLSAEWCDRLMLMTLVVSAEGNVQSVFTGAVFGALVSAMVAVSCGTRLCEVFSEKPMSVISTVVFLASAALALVLA